MFDSQNSISDQATQQFTELPPMSNRGVTRLENAENGSNSTGLVFRAITDEREKKPLGIWTEKSISIDLDWLRYSVEWPKGLIPNDNQYREYVLRRAVMPSDAIFFTGELISNPKGYDTALALSRGSVRYHSQRAEQKIGVEFTGKDLSALKHDYGIRALDLLKYAIEHGANITRLDIALDIFGVDADPLDIHRCWDAGNLKTPAQTVSVIEKNRRIDGRKTPVGKTVYVGSRSSTRYLRVYDKALQFQLPGLKWTRVELELAGARADVVASRLMSEKLDDFGRGLIRSFCWPQDVPWYQDALTGPVVELPEVPRKPSNRYHWLMSQVLPALEQELILSESKGDWSLYDAFSEVLRRFDNR